MDPGLQIAATGMLAEQVRQDQLTNDLSNASTPGYKPDQSSQSSFGQLLLTNTSTGQTIGLLDTGVQIGRTVTDMTPAPLQQTGHPLDFGIAGDRLLRRPYRPGGPLHPRRAVQRRTPAACSSTRTATRSSARPAAPITRRRQRHRAGELRSASSTSRTPSSRATTSSPARRPGKATGIVQSGSSRDPASTRPRRWST